MNKDDEKLSVVLDDYSNGARHRALLDEVSGDVNLQYQMRRYQMIGDVMRHELPKQVDLDLSHQIMHKVNQIDISGESKQQTSDANSAAIAFWFWMSLKPLAGIAVAASVAVVAVTLWQSISQSILNTQPNDQVVSVDQHKINQLVSQPIQGNAVTVSSGLSGGVQWTAKENSPAFQQKLNAYLVKHTEFSTPIQGLIPQARVAGYDMQQ